MKKLLFMLAAIVLVACSNEDFVDDISTQTPVKQNSNLRSYEEALQVAESSISMLDNSESTRSSSSRKIDANNSKVYLNKSVTRSSSNASDTLMYVFNFEDNEGFAIVAAPRDIEPLIAITEKGHYDPDEPSGIEGFDDYMHMAEKYILNSRIIIPDEPNDSMIFIRKITVHHDTIVGPYVSVMWGQVLPEGELCPNGLSGCTNTAMAQIMTYYEYPSSMSITFPNAGVTTESFNWTAMKSHLTGHEYSLLCANQTAHMSISRLLRQLGYMNDSVYNLGDETGSEPTTGTLYSQVPYTISALGYYGGTISNYSDTYVRSQLNEHHLLLVDGASYSSGYNRHSWVLDGYKYYLTIVYSYHKIGSMGIWELYETTTSSRHYNHFNWGMYGSNNGYFYSGIYDTTVAHTYDNVVNIYQGNFEYDVKLINMYRN